MLDGMKTEIKKLENSEIEITGEISTENFEKWREKAVKNISAEAEIPGFRKGTAPEGVIVKRFGEMNILEEMAELAISAAYLEIMEKEKVRAILRPEVSIVKIAKGSPLGFKIKTAVLPEILLPDYKKIAAGEKKEEITVTDDEINKVIDSLRQKRAGKTGEKSGNETNKEEVLPPLTDEIARALGNFKDIEDLKTQIKDNLTKEKEWRAGQKKRAAIAEKIIAETEFPLPRVLVEEELKKMLSEFKGNVANMGLNFEDYLSHLKKTEDDLRKDWEKDAGKRVRLELILAKIAETEKIYPSEAEIETEAGHLLEHYPGADRERVFAYAESVLTKEKVFEWLENIGLAVK